MTKQPERSATRGTALGSLRGSGATASRKARDHAHALRSYLAKPMTSFYLVMTLTFALVAFGLVMMASASAVDSMQSHGSAYYQFNRQLIFVVAGVLAMILAMRVPLTTWRRLSGVLMALTMVMLALVLVPGIGMELYGARRWFNIGGLFSIQPSEFGKIAFLLWGAHVLVRRRKILNTWEGMLMPILPGLILLSALVVIEPDLHTTITYFIIFLGLLWVIGAPFRLFGLMLLGVAAVGAVAVASQGFRMSRVLSFLDPWADAQDTGHQAIQGFYALATGGFFGVGLGNSRTKWGALPNAHSDYIFAIIGEELGFIGCALVLVLFAALAYTGFRIARRTRDLYIRLIAGATSVWMVGQALINIGYVVGLLPVTGITLPLISSGGTSIVVTMFAMGILASCARHEPAAVRHLQSRARRFGRWLSLPVPTSPVLDKDQTPPKAHRSPRTTSGTREPARRTEQRRPAQRRQPARTDRARDHRARDHRARDHRARGDRARGDWARDQGRRTVR
ncbi:putative lipid II flippase FtsW [Blastococcus sp. Marseille-P5729]|uniref:putative lipid II flippase FtsW n=1 Tax=Blastococcus sp. Marseille-P5729 TaxID=2086582 RepID=UPI00131D6E80|nr:putative lipid II flippase FtsW [Blastococcus sp. Marseille-P5729]